MSLAFLKTDPVSDDVVVVETTISAPIGRVWKAWITPEDLKQWFGREAGSVLSAEVDARIGGQWRFRFSANDEGGALEGEYVKVEPESLLVFTWRHVASDGTVSPESLVTVSFADAGAGTDVCIRHEGIEALGSRQNISHGWNDCLINIGRLLAGAA
mgnify:FL=1